MPEKNNLLLIMMIAIVILLSRLFPHAPNFSPLIAAVLFTAVYADKKLFFLPFIALFISDLFIGFYTLGVMFSVYASLGLTFLIGALLKKHKNTLNILSGSLFSALLFFLFTNFAVWYFGNWYAHDLNGLALSYSLAIPFFRSTVLSTVFYSTVLFGTYELVSLIISKKKLTLEKN
ncbi:hypothetical protein H6761_03300 [Candidatus Nomurabacteria bacterium]|nr:hypothetical protein [Candidatus Nomurabacteria bacterium]